MTIKELCKKSDCSICEYYSLCVCTENMPSEFDKLKNEVITKTIIKTARILQEDNNND